MLRSRRMPTLQMGCRPSSRLPRRKAGLGLAESNVVDFRRWTRRALATSHGTLSWSLLNHVLVVLLLAIGIAVATLLVLWTIAGQPRLPAIAALQIDDLFNGIKIALAVVAGIGGVVALVVAYRRQRLGESAETREHSKMLIERFGAAAVQLGADQPAVRMAGAYAMAGLADDSEQQRQQCIDVLCGYIRMPHSPSPPDDAQEAAAWQRERAVRLTVLRLIAVHLRDDAERSWRGYDLDFTGAVIDEADFRGVRFTGGEIIFINTIFVGHGRDQIIFDDVEFANGTHVYFRLAEFRSGSIRFDRCAFTGGWVTFDSARFTGAEVTFREATFPAGEVRFEDAEFAAGRVDFTGASFLGGIVDFREHHLKARYFTVPPARFTGGKVVFTQVSDLTRPPSFGLKEKPPGLELPAGLDISDL